MGEVGEAAATASGRVVPQVYTAAGKLASPACQVSQLVLDRLSDLAFTMGDFVCDAQPFPHHALLRALWLLERLVEIPGTAIRLQPPSNGSVVSCALKRLLAKFTPADGDPRGGRVETAVQTGSKVIHNDQGLFTVSEQVAHVRGKGDVVGGGQ
ncbi:hypothetical protein D9M72_535710 [compost metagenome]